MLDRTLTDLAYLSSHRDLIEPVDDSPGATYSEATAASMTLFRQLARSRYAASERPGRPGTTRPGA